MELEPVDAAEVAAAPFYHGPEIEIVYLPRQSRRADFREKKLEKAKENEHRRARKEKRL